jgi:hypothetical protein
MDWQQAVRYCGMNPENPEAVRLCKKVRSKGRLSSEEVEKVYRLAEEISWVLGTDTYTLPCDIPTPLYIPSKYIMYKKVYKEVVLLRRGDWLVEEVSSKVVGKFFTDRVEVYPNPYVSPGHLEEIVTGESSSAMARS